METKNWFKKELLLQVITNPVMNRSGVGVNHLEQVFLIIKIIIS